MKFIKVTDNKKVFADGIHDDTKALQECIDAVRDGGTVYFPDGTYLVSAALIFYSHQIFMLSDNAKLKALPSHTVISETPTHGAMRCCPWLLPSSAGS